MEETLCRRDRVDLASARADEERVVGGSGLLRWISSPPGVCGESDGSPAIIVDDSGRLCSRSFDFRFRRFLSRRGRLTPGKVATCITVELMVKALKRLRT